MGGKLTWYVLEMSYYAFVLCNTTTTTTTTTTTFASRFNDNPTTPNAYLKGRIPSHAA
jgi:hypothetical protein